MSESILSSHAALGPEVPAMLRHMSPLVVVVGDPMLDGWLTGTSERMAREAPAPVVELGARHSAPGGAANTATNLAALGARVRFVGVTGDDDAGRLLREQLAAAGVDVDGLLLDQTVRTTTKDRVVVGDQVLVRLDDGVRPDYRAQTLTELAATAVAACDGADALVVCDYGTGALDGPVRDALVGRAQRLPLCVVDAHDASRWAALRPDLVTPNAAEAERLAGAPLRAAALPATSPTSTSTTGSAASSSSTGGAASTSSTATTHSTATAQPARGGPPERPGDDRAEAVARHAGTLLAVTGARAVVVTLDRDGTATVGHRATATARATPGARASDRSRPVGTSSPVRDDPSSLSAPALLHRTWARPATEKQASGAGDTFVGALTLARACGLPLATAVDLAQAAADVVVTRPGTSVCSTDDLTEHLTGFADSALSHDELLRAVSAYRAAGRRVVFTNGCFDVLHRGHTAYLNQARRLGDVLVVAINDDASVRRLKGAGRPINPVHDRAGVLASLSCVDHVTVFSEDTPVRLIELLRPEVFAKGGDYTQEPMVESEVVRAHGGEVRILDYLPAHSTSAVVRRIRRETAGAPVDVAGLA